MAYLAQWDVNNQCNLNCKHCRVWKKNDLTQLSLKEGKELISQLKYLGVKQLILSGGEPFIRKDIFELIDYAKSFKKLVITTNGTLLTEEKCKILKKYKNLILSISLDGMKKVHDEFRQVPGTFDKVMETLDMLKANKIKFAIKYTLSNETKEDIYDVIKTVAKKGASEFNVRRVIVFGNAKEKMLLSNEEYREIIKNVINVCKENNIIFKTGDPCLIPIFPEIFGIDLENDDLKRIYAGCQAGDENIYINYLGFVGACSYIPVTADNIKAKALDDILKNEFFTNIRNYKDNLKGKCSKCAYKYICGGCRGSALALKKSLYEEDPLCLLDD
jgi:radical SAM protein with 4Fe4S-binding SPASM domain